jgi:hypothetical protein
MGGWLLFYLFFCPSSDLSIAITRYSSSHLSDGQPKLLLSRLPLRHPAIGFGGQRCGSMLLALREQYNDKMGKKTRNFRLGENGQVEKQVPPPFCFISLQGLCPLRRLRKTRRGGSTLRSEGLNVLRIPLSDDGEEFFGIIC